MASAMSSSVPVSRYSLIRELPYSIRIYLHALLDSPTSQLNWLRVAEHMPEFSLVDVEGFKLEYSRWNGSPTQKMLDAWGGYNHTVGELADILKEIGHMQAVEALLEGRYQPPSVPPPMDHTLREEPRRPPPTVTANSATNDMNLFRPVRECSEPTETNWRSHDPAVKEEIEKAASCAKKSGVWKVKYDQLAKMTKNFSTRSLTEGGFCLASGGYGNVFLGRITHVTLGQTYQVAIKRVHKVQSTPLEARQFATELKTLSQLSQKDCQHLVELRAFSIDGPYPCLLYEYMEGGSLEDRLQMKGGTAAIPWEVRPRLALHIARGLVQLHFNCDPSIIHGDVKSANVLLDMLHINAKLSDFGTAQNLEQRVHDVVAGTTAYMAPETMRGRLSTKSDVYSFGVVILELLTGLKSYCANRPEGARDLKSFVDEQDKHFVKISNLVDPETEDWPLERFLALYDIANKCLQKREAMRPDVLSMTEQLEKLAKDFK